jgi:iron complex outermembrane receptor protein
VFSVSPNLRVRVATGHAFRIPTFTELYYQDPGHLASPDLTAESGWSLDGGVDWNHGPWSASFSPFRRWDRDVIDWVKAAVADRWTTVNRRDVVSTGFELSLARRWGTGLLRAYYSGLAVDAPALNLLSKYVLDYTKRQAGLSASAPMGLGFRGAVNVDYRDRIDGQRYTLLGLRVSRAVARAQLFVDGSNVLNESYREIAGVPMPGRWMTVGVTVR